MEAQARPLEPLHLIPGRGRLKMNVLVSSASRKVSLVRAFQQALAVEGKGKVIAVDSSTFSPALYSADEHCIVPALCDGEYYGVMRTLCREREVDLLIPTSDEELPFFAGHAGEFLKEGTRVMVSPLSAVTVCQDKRRFVEFCSARGFATPANCASATALSGAAFPLFVKPRREKGGRGAVRVDSREELAAVLSHFPDAIVQEFVNAPEYSVDFFADFSGTAISVVPRERIRIFGGESFVSRTSRNAVIIAESVRLAKALGLTGHATLQCFFHSGAAKFIEVNPRFGGGASLGFAAGAPTPLFLVKLVKGERVEPRIGEFRDNYVMLRYTDDMFFEQSSLEGEEDT